MSLASVGKVVGLGTTVGLVGVTALGQPKTKSGEKFQNNMSTLAGLGVLGATPYLVKKGVNALPKEFTTKVVTRTGAGIEKAINYTTTKAPQIATKLKSSKIGTKILDYAGKAVAKVGNLIKGNATLSKIVNKGAQALEKFVKLPTASKGKYALIAAGIAILAQAAIHIIRNHDRKSGAIDQKYSDLRKEYEVMVNTKPIMDARTGEPISFDDFCKIAQTYVK